MAIANRQAFIEQFCQWTDEDIDRLTNEADYTTFTGVFKILADDVDVKARQLLHLKQTIYQIEQQLSNANSNMTRLHDIEEKHKDKRYKYMEHNQKLERQLAEYKRLWKKIQLQHH